MSILLLFEMVVIIVCLFRSFACLFAFVGDGVGVAFVVFIVFILFCLFVLLLLFFLAIRLMFVCLLWLPCLVNL